MGVLSLVIGCLALLILSWALWESIQSDKRARELRERNEKRFQEAKKEYENRFKK